MHSDTELKDSIMRRVWRIYILRQLASPAMRLGVLLATAILIATSVSIKNVLENLVSVSGLTELARFSVSALQNTELPVQILTALALGLAIWFIVDSIRTLVTTVALRNVS